MEAQSVDRDADAAPVVIFNKTADSRFDHPMWDTNLYFNQTKRQYLLSATTPRVMVNTLDELPSVEKQRLNHFCTQIIDTMSRTNFLATNLAALEKAVAKQGQSLVSGLEILARDLEANHGECCCA